MHVRCKSPESSRQVWRGLEGEWRQQVSSKSADECLGLPSAQPISTHFLMQFGLLAVERVWEKPFESYNSPVPAKKGNHMRSKIIRVTFVPHKSRSPAERGRIWIKKMSHLGRHAGPVWILVFPRQMHDWARHVQVIPGPKSFTPRFTCVK